MKTKDIMFYFDQLECLIEEEIGTNNIVEIEVIEEENRMDIQVNKSGFFAHFAYDTKDKEFQFFFDRGFHPHIVAYLAKIGQSVIGDIQILSPYFVSDDGEEQVYGAEAEILYHAWLMNELQEQIDILEGHSKETIH